MTAAYSRPRKLDRTHDRQHFRCRSRSQTEWLHRHALQAQQSRTLTVNVITEVGSSSVVAYFAWRMSSVPPEDLPARFLKGVGRYPQPFVLLARLGVDLDHEGRGLARLMIQDMLTRIVRLTEGEMACRGLEVDAETEAAKAYYLHLIPQFGESPRNPLKLVLFIGDTRKLLATDQPD